MTEVERDRSTANSGNSKTKTGIKSVVEDITTIDTEPEGEDEQRK
jgi:hypothetical protein